MKIAIFFACCFCCAQLCAAESPSHCVDVYLTAPTVWGMSMPKPIFEVSYSSDKSPFVVKGKLHMIDWGEFNVCGNELQLRFRSILGNNLKNGPVIKNFDHDFKIDMHYKSEVYFRLGKNDFREVTKAEGEEDIAKVKTFAKKFNEEQAGKVIPSTIRGLSDYTISPMFLAGKEWIDRRDYYYSKGSICATEKSERCP